MRRAARRDSNEKKQVVAALLSMGASVDRLSGPGLPDLLVGFRGVNVLMEVKDGDKPPSERRLTARQKAWHAAWRGQVAVVKNKREAIDLLLAVASRPPRKDQA